jgi:hypothetical protein
MVYLPLERLLGIATYQARPGVVVGATQGQSVEQLSGISVYEGVDTCLAARMAANALRQLLRAEAWQQRQLGERGLVGEAGQIRLMVWMDNRDEQPGMVAVWDVARPAPIGRTLYGELAPRPVLVIGRNVRTQEHFVMRYAPGDWIARLEQIALQTAGPSTLS